MYDLAIIGAGPEGVAAARQALAFPSRQVALVTQGFPPSPTLNPQIYGELWGQWLRFRSLARQLNYPCDSLAELHRRFQDLSSGLGASPLEPLRRLAPAGVELVWGEGVFAGEKPLTFQVNRRRLQAKHYLLTSLPPLFSPERLRALAQLPFYPQPLTGDRWALLGATPEHIVWAEILAVLGKTVHLLTRNAHLLPEEDPEMAHLLQAYLESQGVRIWTDVQDVKEEVNLGEIRLNLPGEYLTVDYALTAPLKPQKRLSAPPSSQIHVCGAWLSGYPDSALFAREAENWVKRLFAGAKPLDYAQIPFTIQTGVPWSRVGYPPARLPFKPRIEYQTRQGELPTPTQIFKFFLRPRNRKILGAYGWGTALTPDCRS